MIKNVNTAYDELMKVLELLKKDDIEIIIKVPRRIEEAKNIEVELADTIKKYFPPNRLHWSKWRHVSFNISTLNTEYKEEKFKFAREYLGKLGMSFDSGSGSGWVDWEIDWSFSWKENNEWLEKDESFHNHFIEFAKKINNN